MNRHVIGTAAGLLLLFGSTSSMVYAADGPPGPGRRMGPPPEAVNACKGKSEGTNVEFTNSHGEKIKAVCKQINGQLVAVPEGGFRGRKGMLPDGAQRLQ